MSKLKNKNVLIVENDIVTAKTPLRVLSELKQRRNPKSVSLFIDYIAPILEEPAIVKTNPEILKPFKKVIIALNTKVSEKEESKLKNELLKKKIKAI